MSYQHTFSPTRLWTILGIGMVVSLSVLLYFGGQIYQMVPPFPFDVKSQNGDLVFSKQQMLDGQDVWRQLGGMQMGSLWGHGAYLAPDWTADWIHKESNHLLEQWSAQDFGQNFANLRQANRR